MPIYDYACARCGEVTEVIHGIHDAGPRFCPACGAEGSMRKGITTSAVHFKGSGWAKKDRAAAASSGRSRTAKPAGDSGKGDSGTGDSAKSDAAARSSAKGESGTGAGEASSAATAPATTSDGAG